MKEPKPKKRKINCQFCKDVKDILDINQTKGMCDKVGERKRLSLSKSANDDGIYISDNFGEQGTRVDFLAYGGVR